MDITAALAPKSDQLDFADLDGAAPRVFTITAVTENGSELAAAQDQPVNVRLAEFPRVWRPSKGMLRVLADNWGKDVSVWVGRKVELYGDPEVYFGKEKRGGTRISRMSHISKRNTTLINPRGGRGAYWSVDPLPDAPPPNDTASRATKAVEWFAATHRVPQSSLEAHVGKPLAEWDDSDVNELKANAKTIAGEQS